MNIILILLTIVAVVNSWQWQFDAWTASTLNTSNMHLYFDGTKGPADSYWQHLNQSFTLSMYSSKVYDSKLHIVAIPLEKIGRNRLAPRRALIRSYFVDATKDVEIVSEEVDFGEVTLLPYDRLIISTTQADIQFVFRQIPHVFHFVVLFYFGLFSIGGTFFLWKYRIEANYYGLQLASACLRWHLKMMLFDSTNGYNYYFPIQYRGYWKAIHLIILGIQICGVLMAIKKSRSYLQSLRIFLFFFLILIPQEYYIFPLLFLIAFQLFYKYSSTKLLSSRFVCGTWVVLYMFNLLLSWHCFNPFILFQQHKRMTYSYLIYFLLIFQLMIFVAHIGVNPQTLLWSFPYAYFKNIQYFMTKWCRRVQTGECRICESQDTSFFSLQEKYLISKGLWLDYNYLVGTLCGHIFHKKCLMRHLQHSRTCPVDGVELSREWLVACFGQIPLGPAVQLLIQMNQIEPVIPIQPQIENISQIQINQQQ